METSVIVDCATREVTVRKLTKDERRQRDADAALFGGADELEPEPQPDPLLELVDAIGKATTNAQLRKALADHLPRVVNRRT